MATPAEWMVARDWTEENHEPLSGSTEKMMRKADDTSNFATFERHHSLADSELDAVTGGFVGQLISTVLKDLHDVRKAIVANLAG